MRELLADDDEFATVPFFELGEVPPGDDRDRERAEIIAQRPVYGCSDVFTWTVSSIAGDEVPLAIPLASRRVLPGRLLDFKLVLNPGAVFGIGANHRWFFIAFTVVALLVGIHVFGRFSAPGAWPAHAALGLVMSGGVGNLHDRIAFGRVRDFIQVLPGRHLPFDWTWPGTQNPEMFPWVFNLADVWLFVGMVALMVYVDRAQKARKRSDDAEESDERPERRNDQGGIGPVAEGAP